MTEPLQLQKSFGEEAARLLENPAFNEMFDRVERDAYEAWAAGDVRDTEGQRLLLQQVKVMKHLRATLFGMVEQGKLASSKLPIADILGENPLQRTVRGLRSRGNRQ